MVTLVLINNLNNIRNGFHEIAQIETAAQLNMRGYETELEYAVPIGEVDVVATLPDADPANDIYAWEIKPIHLSGASQLQDYLDSGGLKTMQPVLPDIYDIPIIGKIKMGITYGKELGVGHYYFYSVNNCESEYTIVEVENKVKSRVKVAEVVVGTVMAATLLEDALTYGAGMLDNLYTFLASLQLASLVMSYQ